MYAPRYILRSFAGIPVLAKGRVLRHLLEGLCSSNLAWLAFHRTPPLYESGVRYAHDLEADTEDWTDIPEVRARGVGACADLSAWRMAELRAAGDDSTDWHVTVTEAPRADGSLVTLYHIALRRPDPHGELVSNRTGLRWGVECPSTILGMP